jgi:hypothetical protein
MTIHECVWDAAFKYENESDPEGAKYKTW